MRTPILLLALVASACSSDPTPLMDAGVMADVGDPARICIPGAQVACACVGGAAGAQVCAADGRSLGLCACPDAGGVVDTGAPDSGPSDAGPSATDRPPPADVPATGCVDNDGDGYGLRCPLGADCDDTDRTIHPGANESCNGHDDNCDGHSDADDAPDFVPGCEALLTRTYPARTWVGRGACSSAITSGRPASLERTTMACRRCSAANSQDCVCAVTDGTRWGC